MGTFFDRYRSGEYVAVWDELTALGERVRDEAFLADAEAVAAETMRRARHNVELLITRLDARGYRFQDRVSTAEDRLSQLNVMERLAAQVEAWAHSQPGRPEIHSGQMFESVRAMKEKMAPRLERMAAEAARAAYVPRRPPLEDPNVFTPPDEENPDLIARLEETTGGPLPLSLRAWYEQVGGVSLMGSDPVLNPVDFSNRDVLRQFSALTATGARAPRPPQRDFAPDPLVIFPLHALLDQFADADDEEAVQQLAIAPDDLHKANISGDAYYLRLPDSRADFEFDDWHHTTFVGYLRTVFRWGGFPGWERYPDAPLDVIAELTEGLLPL
jgi:hypothetical protein